MEGKETRDRGEVSLAVLNCPDTVNLTMTNICGADANDAEVRAIDSAKQHYACNAPCDLNVSANAGQPGGHCLVDNQTWAPGRLYDVTLRITCR